MQLTPRQLQTTPPNLRSQWLGVWNPTTPKTRQIVRCLTMLTHARSYLKCYPTLPGEATFCPIWAAQSGLPKLGSPIWLAPGCHARTAIRDPQFAAKGAQTF